jgi:hypothetical protein
VRLSPGRDRRPATAATANDGILSGQSAEHGLPVQLVDVVDAWQRGEVAFEVALQALDLDAARRGLGGEGAGRTAMIGT